MAHLKEHKEFHAVDMTTGWETLPGYPAGIEQKILAGFLDEAGRRGNRNRKMFPVDHVVADRVSPVHVAPVRAVWVVLIEHVILAAPVDRTVGIVHPIRRGQQMVLGAAGIGGQLRWRRRRENGVENGEPAQGRAASDGHDACEELTTVDFHL